MGVDARELQERLREFGANCRVRGIKATHQRSEIYRELVRTDTHPDAETIYTRVRRRIPRISLDTVYRNLRLLEDRGIISRVKAVGERARFDANPQVHHHFVCTQCGLVKDFYSDKLDRFSTPREVSAVGTVSTAQVQLRGVCHRCASN